MTAAPDTPLLVTPTVAPTTEVLEWPVAPRNLPVVELQARSDPPPSPDRVITLVDPESPFPEPPRPLEEVLLYDFETGRTDVLGPSLWGGALFSPDGRYLAWTTPVRVSGEGTLHVRDTSTGVEREFAGVGPGFQFLGDHLISVRDQLIDIVTGDVRIMGILPEETAQFDDGLLLRGSFVEASGSYSRRWVVWTDIEGEALFEVTGWLVDVLDEETVAVMTEPVDGLATVYLVDVPTLTVTVVATTRQPFPGDLEGGDRHLAWTENTCQVNDEQTGFLTRLRVWDRDTGALTEFKGASFVADVRDGWLAAGAFGADGWVDIETGEWLAVLPTSGERAGWSPDLRYASVGRLLGHGGRCP